MTYIVLAYIHVHITDIHIAQTHAHTHTYTLCRHMSHSTHILYTLPTWLPTQRSHHRTF